MNAAAGTNGGGSVVIRAEDVARTYRVGATEVHAVRGFTQTISRGEFVVLRGPSGCGKTTLLNLFGCIDTPTTGRLRVFERDTSSLSETERARMRLHRIGFVFQRFFLLPMLTALENVELPMIEARVPKGERRARAGDLLARVGLAHRLRHRPGQLSGGEMQRVAIARALANSPELVIADEPTGELDHDTGMGVMQLVKRLQEDGITIVMATHDAHAAALGDRVLDLDPDGAPAP